MFGSGAVVATALGSTVVVVVAVVAVVVVATLVVELVGPTSSSARPEGNSNSNGEEEDALVGGVAAPPAAGPAAAVTRPAVKALARAEVGPAFPLLPPTMASSAGPRMTQVVTSANGSARRRPRGRVSGGFVGWRVERWARSSATRNSASTRSSVPAAGSSVAVTSPGYLPRVAVVGSAVACVKPGLVDAVSSSSFNEPTELCASVNIWWTLPQPPSSLSSWSRTVR